MSTGAAMKGIALIGFGPAALGAFSTLGAGAGLLVATLGAALFYLGSEAEREVDEAVRRATPQGPPEPLPPLEKPRDLVAFELACAIDQAWSDEGPDLFELPDVYVTTRDLYVFTVGPASGFRLAVPLASVLDRARLNAWLSEVDDGGDPDWPTLLLDDETGWNPAEALAERAIEALEALRRSSSEAPDGSVGTL